MSRGFVLARVELHAGPLVVDVGGVGGVEDASHLRRNEGDAFPVAHHQIAGHDRDVADADGNVDARERGAADGARVHGPVIARHIHVGDAVEIAEGAIHNETAALGGLHDVVEEIVADDGAAFFLPEQVHHQHIARLQHVEDILIAEGRDALARGPWR